MTNTLFKFTKAYPTTFKFIESMTGAGGAGGAGGTTVVGGGVGFEGFVGLF